jgi:putative ABC transport system permease protein
MLRHLLQLIWKRKTRNLMLLLEISIAFAVVFGVSAFALRQWQLYKMPLGFEFERVWAVQLQAPDWKEITSAPALVEEFKRLMQAQPEVERAALAGFAPYTNSANGNSFVAEGGGHSVGSNLLSVSDEFFATMGLRLVEGRWFGPEDGGTSYTPVVINQRLAAQMFAGRSALGQAFTEADLTNPNRRRYRVTGVFDAYRDHGEFMNPVPYLLSRFDARTGQDVPGQLVLKLKPGTPRAFEATLNTQLKQLRNHWSYRIVPLTDLRTDKLRMVLMPLTVVAVVATFLLLMVAFGLFGVLWQNTTQRIPEIGLRRALGAQASQIYRQIVAEQVLLSSLAIALALALLVQLPLTGTFDTALNWGVFGGATLLSMAVIYAVSILCALYPGWQASRLQPAEALHHE